MRFVVCAQVKISRDMGLRPLIELLSSSMIEIQEQAVIALRNLCANSENQVKVPPRRPPDREMGREGGTGREVG